MPLYQTVTGEQTRDGNNWCLTSLRKFTDLTPSFIQKQNRAQARYLTTKKDDGSAFSRDDAKFDFYTCDSKYMGYTTENQGKSIT